MPNYEYRCMTCQKKFEIRLSYEQYEKSEARCPFCNGENIERIIGRIRIAHSNTSRMENLADPAALDRLEDDPQTLGRMMRQMSSEIGEDMGGEFDEVVSRLEAGQRPDQIERELPDIDAPQPAPLADD